MKKIFIPLVFLLPLLQLHFRRGNDLSIYDAAQWWEADSPFRILRKMNVVRVPYFLAHADFHNPLLVLDVGCGGGFVSEELALASPGSRVVGIDISQSSISQAALHANEAGIPESRLQYIVGSIYKLPYADNSVDVVIASDVFEHLDRLDLALTEIFRVLKPKSGILLFDTIAKSWWSWLSTYFVAQQVLGLVVDGAHDWDLFVSADTMHALLVNGGFRDYDISSWKGIVADLNLFNAISANSIHELISGFRPSDSDLSANYMGFARKR